MHKHDMPEEAKEGLQAVRENSHGIVTIIGIIVAVAVGLLMDRGLVFGLVMGAVFSSGLGAGRKIAEALAENAAEHAVPGKIVGAIVTGIIAAGIIAVIRGAVGESINVMEGDNVIIQIVKYFFDASAAAAVGIGALAGVFLHRDDSE